MNGSVEPGLHRLSDEPGILAIGLDRRGLGQSLHVPGFDTHGGQAALGQAAIQIRRQQPSLKAGQRERAGLRLQEAGDGGGLTGHLAFADHPTPLIHHANRRQTQRDVQPSVMFHDCMLPFSRPLGGGAVVWNCFEIRP